MSAPTWGDVNAALAAESLARGFCWCAIPLRGMVDCTGLKCAECQQPITAESYALTARQRGDAVNARMEAVR